MERGCQQNESFADGCNQVFFPRDKPGTLRAVGGDALCACAGESCSSASMLNKTGRPYGGCRPQTRPAPPWFNFSSARTFEYMANPTTGMVDTHIVQRQATFTGLPRGVWPNCSKLGESTIPMPGQDNSHGYDDVDGHLSTSDNPLRLKDGSLIVQVAVCLGDRVLGWNGNCGLGFAACGGDFGSHVGGPCCCGQPGTIGSAKYICPREMPRCIGFVQGKKLGFCSNSSMPAPPPTGSLCMAPTQVIFRTVDEGLMWRYIGTLMNPAGVCKSFLYFVSFIGTKD